MASSTRAPLSRERIVAAAIGIADRDGLAALTMRHLAAELDCEAMSLYHHVPGKEALLGALVDAVLAEIAAASTAISAPEWRDAVRARCLAARAIMLRHPWAPPLVVSQTATPASAWPVYELFVATLADAGLDDDLVHRAVHAVGSMLFGFSTELFQPEAPVDDGELAAMRAMAERTPNLARMAATVVHEVDGALSMCDTAAEFAFTLDLLLDGLEAARRRTA